MVRLLRLLDRPRDIRVLAPLVEREILWRLITGEQGAIVRQLGLADSSLTHIARAVRWIRDHYAQSFRVEDVAQLSGMSVSAFYRNFQAVTAMSPIQFQKQIRLQEARLLLAARPTDVTGVGHRSATTARRSSAASTAASSARPRARTRLAAHHHAGRGAGPAVRAVGLHFCPDAIAMGCRRHRVVDANCCRDSTTWRCRSSCAAAGARETTWAIGARLRYASGTRRGRPVRRSRPTERRSRRRGRRPKTGPAREAAASVVR